MFCGGWGAGKVFVVRTKTLDFASRATSFRVCFLEIPCTSEKIVHAQGRQNSEAVIELTSVSFEGLLSPPSFFPFHYPVPSTEYISILWKEKQ